MANPTLDPLFGPVGDQPASSVMTNGWTDGVIPTGPEHTYLWHQLYAAANKSANDGIWDWQDPATSDREYNIGSITLSNGHMCYSKVDSNTADPSSDDGTNWENYLPMHIVANSSTAFGIPIKIGTTVLDASSGLYYQASAIRSASHTIADGSVNPITDGIDGWQSTVFYAQYSVVDVPSVGPAVCVNVAGSTNNNPTTDDGTYWVNYLPTHTVANSSTAFGIPLKAGTTVLDLATGLYYRTTAIRTAAHTLGDGSIEVTVNTGTKNLIINGDKTIQQRGTTGGTRQVIDAENVKISGTYAISFTGAATVQVYEATTLEATDAGTTWTELTSGESASGTSVTVTAGKHIKVEFSSTDFSFVQFEPGSVPTNFEQKNYAIRLAECQRYYQEVEHASHDAHYGTSGAGKFNYNSLLPTPMRDIPDVVYAGGVYQNCSSATTITLNNMLANRVTVTATGEYRYYGWIAKLNAEHFTDTYYEDRWF
jgi:hypothetical protein